MTTERTCTQDAITRRRTHSAAITDCMLIASLISIRGTQRHSSALTHAAASAVAERIVSVRPAEKRAVEHDSYLMREAIKMHPDALRRSQSAHVEPTLPTTQSDDIKTQSKCNQTQSECSRGADPPCYAIEGELHRRLYDAIGRHSPSLQPLGSPQGPVEVANLE